MFNKSISYKLSIYISLAVIAVFIAFIVIIYFYNLRLLKENIEDRAIGISMQVNARVDQNIIATREITSNVARQVLYYYMNDDLEAFVAQILREYDFLHGIHINLYESANINRQSFFSTRSADSIRTLNTDSMIYECFEEYEAVSEFRNSEQPGWTEAFRCEGHEELLVSFYCPVFEIGADNDTILAGEVISELSLLQLNESINEMPVENGGYAFIVDKEGRYITHPDETRILKQNLFDLPEKVIDGSKYKFREIMGKNLKGSAIGHPEFLNFKKAWIYFTPVNQDKWYLLFVLPYNELFSDLYMLTLRLLFLSVIGILAIYFIVTYITNLLIEPLTNVTSQLTKFSSQTGNSSQETLDEIQMVSESLKSLKIWYEKYKDQQNKDAIRNNLQQQDLMQASEIQQSIIKTDFSNFPVRSDIDLYAIYEPARIVSGDLFDYFFIEKDVLIFTIGDVSGKGVPAAIFMSIAQTLIKSNASFRNAKKIVNKANNDLCTNNHHQFFLTLFLGVLDLSKGELHYCNAAHTSPVIMSADGSMTELTESHGLPLGLYPDKEYFDSKYTLQRGDTIVLYTDGVTELQNVQKKQFGIDQFKKILQPYAGMRPRKITEGLKANLEEYRGREAQYDDLTVFVIQYNG